MAAQGYAKTMTYQLLGISRNRFEAILELIGPVDFPSPYATRGAKAARLEKRGVYTDAMRRCSAKAGKVRHEKAKRTLRGVTGTIEELVKVFSAGVCAPQVRRRMRQGMSLEEAIFTPKSRRNNLGKLLGVTPDRRREALAAQARSKED